MQSRIWILAGPIFGLLLSSCGEVQEEAPPASRPVKIFSVSGPGDESLRQFPGSVRASQRADMAFRVAGVLQEILVREGEDVKKDQLLAKLDPTDFKITLEDRQASFDNAERNFTRAKELIVPGNISKLDYDRMEANFKTTRAALSQARQDLVYTELKAPFDGSIGQREVENFEEVMAKQTIFRFQNTDRLDVMIDLPESLVRSFTQEDPTSILGGPTDRDITSNVRFEGRAGESFPLELKEVATKADTQTQTFQVTLTMDQPTEFRVLPGMTATVSVDFSRVMTADRAKWVPVTAVQADSGLEARVWILDDASMTVSSLPVTIGRMSGRRIEVKTGLSGGEEVVSVGAPYLAEGMRVTRMKKTEQAESRADEAS